MAASGKWHRSVLRRVDVRHPVLVAPRRDDGFTFLEAILALTLSTLIVSLVASVLWAQNDFYALVVERAKVQDNLRVVSDLIASEIRGVSGGGVTTAQSRRFVVRLPLAVGGFCDGGTSVTRVYMPGLSDIDSIDVAGYAKVDGNGDWVYTAATWGSILASSGSIDAADCANRRAADTVGASQDFARISAGTVAVGDVIIIYQEVEFKIDESELDPTTLAVFRGVTGDTLREFATGITPDTKFEYSKDGGATFGSSITGAALDSIEVLRVTALAIASDSLGAVDAYEDEWTVKIPLRNSN